MLHHHTQLWNYSITHPSPKFSITSLQFSSNINISLEQPLLPFYKYRFVFVISRISYEGTVDCILFFKKSIYFKSAYWFWYSFQLLLYVSISITLLILPSSFPISGYTKIRFFIQFIYSCIWGWTCELLSLLLVSSIKLQSYHLQVFVCTCAMSIFLGK